MSESLGDEMFLVILFIWGLCAMLCIGGGIVWGLEKLGLIDIEE